MATDRTFQNMTNEYLPYGIDEDSGDTVPFKSVAQQRFLFAKKPQIAKKWAKEKTPPKKNSWAGMIKKMKGKS